MHISGWLFIPHARRTAGSLAPQPEQFSGLPSEGGLQGTALDGPREVYALQQVLRGLLGLVVVLVE